MDHTIPHIPCQGFLSAQNAHKPRNSWYEKGVPQVDRKQRLNTKYGSKLAQKFMRKRAWMRSAFKGQKDLK
jgi:hypothetical protein